MGKDTTVVVDNEPTGKTRVKNESGDSGMSENLAKGILGTPEADVKNSLHENIDEMNSDKISINEISGFVSAENDSEPSTNVPGNMFLQDQYYMPASGSTENRALAIDMSTVSKTDSILNATSIFARSQTGQDSDFNQTTTSLNSQNTTTNADNVLSHLLRNDVQSSQNAGERGSISKDECVPLLTVIPTPACMSESVSQNESRLNYETNYVMPDQIY